MISVLTIAGAVAGCSMGGDSPGAPNTTEATESGHHPGAAPSQEQPATVPEDAALQLQALLGHQSIVASEMMRARIRGDEDFAQSANAALGKNTDAMSAMVESLLGQPAAAGFKGLWSDHVTALFDYARGVAEDNAEAREGARSTLERLEGELAAFFVTGAQGRLPADAADTALRAHVDRLLRQTDAYAGGDYAEANGLFREAYSQAFGLGRELAVAILGPQRTAAIETPGWRLRSELTRLLGEHVVLAVAATRAGVTNAPDFAAAAEAVNANTADLTAAVDVLFGGDAASSFLSLWSDHIDQVVGYTVALVTQDQAGREAAQAELDGFEGRLAEFLSGATASRIPPSALAEALAMHDEHLIEQVNAFAAKDYQAAHDTAYTTYEHMRELATQLAAAFGDSVAERLPSGGPETGLGGGATRAVSPR